MKNQYILIVLLILFTTACTRYDNPAPTFEDYDIEADKTIRNKVLIITIDGLVGSQMQDYKPPTIAKMLEKSKYSYAVQTDINTADPPSIVTLFTGYPSSSHHVLSDSFLPEFDPTDSHEVFEFKPSLIYRVEEKDRRKQTAVVMRNLEFTNAFLSSADQSKVMNTDAEVKDAGVAILTDNPNLDLLVLQFSDVQQAGIANGFINSNASYKAALDQVDNYINEVNAALELRENYAYENWLVVICSAHGGTAMGEFGGSSEAEMSTFCMYYAKDFTPAELKAEAMFSFFANGYFPGTYTHYTNNSTRTFEEMGVRAQTPAGEASSIFNPAKTGELTLEFKMKLREDNFWSGLAYSGGYRNYYNNFLGKDVTHGVDAGWHVMGQDRALNLRLQNGSGTEELVFSRGEDGSWNHFTLVFKAIEGKTQATVYVNGLKVAERLFNYSVSSFQNQEPLTIGFNHGTTSMAFLNADMADVRAWNIAMNDAQVAEVACLKWITASHPLSEALLAYYTEFNGVEWVNTAPTQAPAMQLSGHPAYLIGSNYTACESKKDEVYLQNIDLTPQVLYWLDLTIDDTWKLPGTIFLRNFENEFRR